MISVKCPFCASQIKINRATNSQKCSSCGNEFLLEANEHNNEQTLLDNGQKLLELKEYEKAMKTFEKAADLAPDNYAAWLGIAKAESKNFTFFTFDNLPVIEKYVNHAIESAHEDEIEEIEKQITPFIIARENKNFLIKQKKQIHAIHVAANVLFIISFLLTVAVNIYYTTISPSVFFWRIVGTIILSGIMFFINYVCCSAITLVKPKNWFSKTLFFIVVVAVIVIINSFNLYLARSI